MSYVLTHFTLIGIIVCMIENKIKKYQLQVRLYYDWFLIPGSCKCWRPDYFSRYVKRKSTSPEL